MNTVVHACTAKMSAWGFFFILFFYYYFFFFGGGGGGGWGDEQIRFRMSKDDFEISGFSKCKIKTKLL